MKSISLISILVLLTIAFGCKKEPDPDPQPPKTHEYQINIIEPVIDFILLEDTLRMKIEVSDLKGGVVENVRFRIYNMLDSTEIFSKPEESNIAYIGTYLFEDSLTLAELPAHTNWILECKAWGKKAGEYEVMKNFQFHVHDGN